MVVIERILRSSALFFRVVLDESHVVRNMNTQRFKACESLTATYRWCITGTLIVNTVADLEAPLRFVVTADSFVSYGSSTRLFCHRFLKMEPFYSDSALFKRLVARPIGRGDAETLIKVRTLMKTLSIRRDKTKLIECKLPEKKETIVFVEMNERERKAYDAVAVAVESFARSHLFAAGAPSQSQSILALIMRLRQLCLDLRLVPARTLTELMAAISNTKTSGNGSSSSSSSAVQNSMSPQEKLDLFNRIRSLLQSAVSNMTQDESDAMSSADAAVIEASASEVTEDVNECAVCLDPLLLENCNIFRICKHVLCKPCTGQLFNGKKSVPCPLCRTIVAKSDVVSYAELSSSVPNGEAGAAPTAVITVQNSDFKSSKTNEILKAINRIRSNDSSERVVIFSSFVSYLDILQAAFQEEGISFCRIDGSMSQQLRQQQIRLFSNDTDDQSPAVMLCSLKACGVGITLTRANHIFLTDLWWAPSIDAQAIDRVHRLGQRRVVQVYRFMVSRSIDEKIYALQRKKLEVSKAAMEKEASAADGDGNEGRGAPRDSSQRLDDLRMLLLSQY
jgi:SNF2 family DNA or RNA helicase